MNEQFIVQLRAADRAEEFLPYIEAIARPGIEIVFLVHYDPAEFTELMDQVQASRAAALFREASPTAESKPWLERHEPRAALFYSLVGLRRRGVELSVSVYSGRARKAAELYARDNAPRVLMMSPSRSCAALRWIRRIGWLAPFRKTTGVLLVRRQ